MNPVEMLLQDATPIQRKLLERVKFIPETECWEWIGTFRNGNPASIHIGKPVSPRRLSFEEFIGPLITGDKLKVGCGNEKCVNPSHLNAYLAKFWTKEKCAEEALKHKTRSNFSINAKSAYLTAHKKGWLDEVCGHMVLLMKPSGHWTKEKCAEEALKHQTKKSFEKTSSSAFSIAHKKGWIDEICAHMTQIKKPHNYWTKERCAEEALKHQTKKSFEKAPNSAYGTAHRKGWLGEICTHMTTINKPHGYWTKERCAEEALKHQTPRSFEKTSRGAYCISHKKGWADEICAHMLSQRKP